VSCHWQHNWAPRIDEQYRALATSLVNAGARIVWGHSPHHFQGVEWIGESVVLYSTGDLLNDYAVDPSLRNNCQLLFELTLDGKGVRSLRALPLELDFGRTRPAGPGAASWIERRFRTACRDLGTRVERDGEWLALRGPAGGFGATSRAASRWPVESS
jgi:poly-gamma-glutamate synthesis protein (capsule biosynthesis protein)